MSLFFDQTSLPAHEGKVHPFHDELGNIEPKDQTSLKSIPKREAKSFAYFELIVGVH